MFTHYGMLWPIDGTAHVQQTSGQNVAIQKCTATFKHSETLISDDFCIF